MQNEDVRKYYDILEKRKNALLLKRAFDIIMSVILIVVLSPALVAIWLIIKLDSPGNAIFKQKRVTKYGKEFNVFKFRTMVINAESLGSQVTSSGDPRITKCGTWLRKLRLDELPQLFNILTGDLSFVGVRPEVSRYVKHYTAEMVATLLMPAGVTSMTSILYKDESKLLENSKNPDETYVYDILPAKMKYNLEYIKNFGFWYDLKIMVKTVIAVIKK
jgi:lipopolysaccharide/colanic/teichoic acid biosynthesis glycosyltransferase